MADCIFNGTTKRPPLGMAEVTLSMEDPELAEAARFVMEGAGDGEKKDFTAEGASNEAGPEEEKGFNTENTEKTESTKGSEKTGILRSGAEAPTNAQPEAGGKFKRKKKEEKPALVAKPGEVVVSRRLYRSGQSEYLINGRVARLRDIQEMFMGVGLGPDSYAIIEQERIRLILSTKPMERRAIIEEAAGVTKFKTKKRLAEAKLESSKLNLARVNDIV